MYQCDFECLGVVHRRQQSRQPARQHGLAGSRRTNHEDVVCARGCDGEGALRESLPFDVVESCPHRIGRARRAEFNWRKRHVAAEVLDDIRQGSRGECRCDASSRDTSVLFAVGTTTVRPIRSAASVEGSTPDVERKSPPKPS